MQQTPPLVLPHLGCVEWICQMNGVGLFFHANYHRFAFSVPAANKTNGRVIFGHMEVCDCIHVYVDLIATRAG
jgi:hypothetical protein